MMQPKDPKKQKQKQPENGISHRDIKPENILIQLNEKGEIEKFALCDFSEGKVYESSK